MIPVILALLWAATTTNAHRVCPLGGDTCAVTVPPICPSNMAEPDNIRVPEPWSRPQQQRPAPNPPSPRPEPRPGPQRPAPRPDPQRVPQPQRPAPRPDIERLSQTQRPAPRPEPQRPAPRPDPQRFPQPQRPVPRPETRRPAPPTVRVPEPQATSFDGSIAACNYNAYLIQDNRLYQMDLTSGQVWKLSDQVRGQIAGLVYNHFDHYLYGIRYDEIVRVYHNGTTEPIHKLSFVPTMGALDSQGRYWVSIMGRRYAAIDLHPHSRFPGTTLTEGESIFPRTGLQMRFPTGWTISPADPGYAYGIGFDYYADRPALFRWESATHTWEHVSTGTEVVNGDSFSAVVSTADGFIYGLGDNSGDIVWYNLKEPRQMSVLRRVGPVSRLTSKSNTAARCALLDDVRRRRTSW
ncbi:hypothetical protein CP533_2464 [Ophiocordyceps camponoti-saundersi (nom. inval.)]|nr:hypothetical protein CP533_2464 [Ophiocordyceps camponoti-saundersi (nom. inval.)]